MPANKMQTYHFRPSAVKCICWLIITSRPLNYIFFVYEHGGSLLTFGNILCSYTDTKVPLVVLKASDLQCHPSSLNLLSKWGWRRCFHVIWLNMSAKSFCLPLSEDGLSQVAWEWLPSSFPWHPLFEALTTHFAFFRCSFTIVPFNFCGTSCPVFNFRLSGPVLYFCVKAKSKNRKQKLLVTKSW